MRNIVAHICNPDVTLSSMPTKRDWMDDTWKQHAYRCLPINIANGLGWTISYPEEISFIWDGISDQSDAHVKILTGHKYANANRGNASISFNTDIVLETKEDISLLLMPVPNQFIDGVQCFTSIVSPSVLKAPIPCAWKITKANEVISIPANTPIFSIVPISLKILNDYEIELLDGKKTITSDFYDWVREYGEESLKIIKTGGWTNFYRDAVDHKGNTVGKHELKNIRFKVKDSRNLNDS